MSKSFVCTCEDITVDDCEHAIADGYIHFEDLKRFLGLATGPCQGKRCVAAATCMIAKARGIDPSDVDVMTFRPPVRPVALETLAAKDGDA